ncbi:uncharacterized protein MELLADRAFT_66521 [Melampsora larici-populina 98AG31]|uniref:Uncharacterized protein n=1 Tax=Melampsora larici-populina (strain 98AG31 / pathotype 3-4-7) TaxID=747676 RepID=F4RZJ4_MELLP|nr:uncharacterized protein MELLADRAFT_66521 [Melampsora larici-populina 98AG31]EGG02246.1 hypothetical protein MELLADRAFT_66521 [Melampsora larici-populina 98AG31]
MSSLLITIQGLPHPLSHRLIGTTIYGSIKAFPNDHLQLEGVRELSKKPTIAYGGGLVFEVLFKRNAASEWFNLCARSGDYLGIIGWDHKGHETERIYNLHI